MIGVLPVLLNFLKLCDLLKPIFLNSPDSPMTRSGCANLLPVFRVERDFVDFLVKVHLGNYFVFAVPVENQDFGINLLLVACIVTLLRGSCSLEICGLTKFILCSLSQDERNILVVLTK